MVTIYDIAKACNTSHATVIRALKDQPHVNEETRKRIKDLAKNLGYRPSHAGRMLKSGKTNTIGLVLPDFANPYYIEFLRSVETGCFERGYQVVAIEFAMDAKRERMCLEQMLEGRSDGVITFFSRYEPVKKLIEEFWFQKIPCVAVGWPKGGVDSVSVDVVSGMERVIDHLVELGHRNIVLFNSSPSETGVAASRRTSFERGLRKHELPFSDKNVFSRYTGDQRRDGIDGVQELMKSHPETTAIIGTNDLLIAGVMRGLWKINYRVPEDISLVGVDNTWMGQTWPIALTSIDLRTAELGQLAVKCIFDRMENQSWETPEYVELESHLIVRESTGPVRLIQK
jgi:DNA-binding LacI/PurR family transcriptional regulator